MRRTLRSARLRVTLAIAAAALLATATAARADDADPWRTSPPLGSVRDPSHPAVERRDAEAFFDAILAGLMRERRVPGVVVIVIQHGAVLFEKGYGVANLESGATIDPETTLFRVASVSKLFTTTAVMQLVEQGKLDLDADVNGYLADFQVPQAFGKPITLRNLLTHTPGFDDAFLETITPIRPAGTPREPLGHALAELLPRRVLPPGEVIAYSNRGLALAGHLVERASGEVFDDYLRAHVLAPLAMDASGFEIPDPPPGALATGYDWRGGRYVPMGLDSMRIAPAGGFFTSAGEIARFMQMHLDLGAVAGASDASGAPLRLLREDTAREMQRTQFRHHPELPGWCLGFEEHTWNGVRTIGHGGSWRGYGTQLLLVPSANLGLFVSSTRSFDPRFFDPLLDAFFDRFFPRAAPRENRAPTPEAAARAHDYEGSYLPVRRMRHEFLKLGDLLSQVEVTKNDDGSLTLTPNEAMRDPLRLVEIGPDLFAAQDGDERVHFRRDAERRVDQLRLGNYAFDRLPSWKRRQAHAAAAFFCIVLFAGTVIGYPIGTLVRRLFGGPASGVPAAARAVAWTFSLLALAFVLGIGVALTNVDPFSLMGGVPTPLRALFVLPLVAIPLSLALPVFLVRSRGSRSWTPIQRVHVAALFAGAVLFAVLCWYWNLLGVPR